MLIYPNINPIAVSLGSIKIHWYGIMYLLGFTLAWLIANYRCKAYKLDWSKDQIGDLIYYAALGLIIGGRVGYMLFYSTSELIHNPLSLVKIWQGGMSFHGGLIGGMLGLYLFAKHYHKSFLQVTDFTAPLIPLGLATGRIGNFINGELWGRPTDIAWGMVFPHVDALPRHPSQLYEFGLEGVFLFLILFTYSRKPRPAGYTTALFLLFYGVFRFSIEFVREPDTQIGYLFHDWLTMGQLLTIPLILLGIFIGWYQKHHAKLS
jgi:phosphatidylglycerol:prolipoprotein diacylglycerol transferase